MSNIVDELIRLGNRNSCDTLSYLKLPNHISNEAIQAGFKKALDHFEKAKCLYRNGEWVIAELENSVDMIEVSNLEDYILEWLNNPINIEKEPLIQQRILVTSQGRYLACKLNHVLADGISLLIFFEAQLKGHFRKTELLFKDFPPKKNTPYKSLLPSQRIQDHKISSGKRNYLSFQGPRKSNNDLIKAIFKTLKELGIKRRCVWLPVNIRKEGIEGFGNGISRIRIYDRENVSIKRQKIESLKNGELIGIPKLKSLNLLQKFLIQLFLNRPLIDYGSIILSHFDEQKMGEGILGDFPEIYGILNLHHRYSMALYVHSTDKNHYTLVYDSGLVDKNTAERFKDVFLQSLA